PNRPVSRENLLARARGRDHEALGRSIDVQILRLRQIVEADPARTRSGPGNPCCEESRSKA
ncbi:winged helix-turn-helix domain-containing protein, partial [Caballeronia sp. M23-90]